MIHVTSLASGSAGNALLIQADHGALLVDCGLTQRAIERSLRSFGLAPSDLAAIVLTHEHGDHSRAAVPLARRHQLPLLANQPTLDALADAAACRQVVLPVGSVMSYAGFRIESFPVPHDAAAPVGYRIESDGWRLGIAVDLGSWNEQIVAGLQDTDLLIIEANHDLERLRYAPYAWPVKQRIFGPLGHLDNLAAAELIAQVVRDRRKRTVWLAHLSEQANSPEIAQRAVRQVLSLEQIDWVKLAALPRQRSLTWESQRHMSQATLSLEL